jgi:hypothetical protein
MPPFPSIRFGPFAPVAGLAIGFAMLQVFGPAALAFFMVPLIAFMLCCYARIRQTDEGGLAPRNDVVDGSDTVEPGRFVSPLLLAVVPMAVPDSDPIDVVVWLPAIRNFKGILSPEQVLGRLARSVKDGGALDPANFLEHQHFMQFLHEFLARELPGRPRLQEESRRQQEGWVSWVDERALDGHSQTEPDVEDVIGRFRVHSGLIKPGSYQPNPGYRLLTEKGMFRLDFALRERLRQEIIARHAFRQAGSAPASVM